jgi:ADP-heptose:LPS heptosyltransferase
MNRVAFVREGGLGDVLMTIPTVRVLSKEKKIDYYTSRKYFPLLRKLNCNVKTIQDLDKSKYSKVYDLRNQLENYKLPLNQQHRVDAVAEYCKVELEDKTIDYIPSIEAQSWADRFCEHFIPPEVITIGLAWRSAFRLRSWPDMYAYNFCKLFDPLYYRIILLGENGDYRFSSSSIVDTCGYLSIEQTAAVIEKLDILVTNDNGLLHLGGNFDIPMIALFGSLPPEWRVKYYSKCHVVVADNLKCLPCMEWQIGKSEDRHYCINIDVRCMSALKPLRIYHETIKYLEAKNERKIY